MSKLFSPFEHQNMLIVFLIFGLIQAKKLYSQISEKYDQTSINLINVF